MVTPEKGLAGKGSVAPADSYGLAMVVDIHRPCHPHGLGIFVYALRSDIFKNPKNLLQ